MKRFTLLSLFALLTICVQAYDFKYGDLYYNIIYNGKYGGTPLVEVTYQKQDSPDNYSGLTSVVVPELVSYNDVTYAVTRIGDSAFLDCSGLTTIAISDSVRFIGEAAFENCTVLTSITIPNSVTSIGLYAFEGCNGLTKTNYTGSVADWCKIDFYDASSNPVSYSHNLFINDVLVMKLSIPEYITVINNYAFHGCSNLTSVSIPNGVTSIGDFAFSDCSGLTSVSIPNSVRSIGESAFYHCTSLASITIPNGVTSIGKSAFSDCSGLTSVSIPNSVRSIGKSAFSDCSGLTSVSIPNGVTSIGESAFYRCTSLASITIPNGVTSIERETFQYCYSLTSVIIPDGVTSIGEYAFYCCTSLASITIPNGVTSIGESAFSDCIGLTSVSIPNSVRSIGFRAFDKVPNIAYFGSATDDSPWGARSMNGFVEGYLVYADATKETLLACSSSVKGIVAIPSSVTSIGNSAFYGCYNLTSITIPNSVTSIEKHAFQGCSGLTSVTIPNNVTTVGEMAFYYCTGLTSVTIGRSVTSIGAGVFAFCSKLREVIWNAKNCHIPYRFSSGNICETPFDYYTLDGTRDSITSFVFGSEVDSIPNYICYGMHNLYTTVISDGVVHIGNYAFEGCGKLQKMTIPNSVMSIGNGTFAECQGLTSITIPNSVTSIGFDAFEACHSLTSITIPNSVRSIGNYAFSNCSSLKEVTSLAVDPPTFNADDVSNATLYVPCNSLSLYANSKWHTIFPNMACMSDDPTEPSDYNMSVTASDNAAYFEWEIYPNAASYSFTVLSVDDYNPLYAITFNAQGVATKNGKTIEARHIENGFGFELRGFDDSTEYRYDMVIRDMDNQIIYVYYEYFITDPIGQMSVLPSYDKATFVWYANPLATSYLFTLSSASNELLYSLTFDAQGIALENRSIHADLTEWGFAFLKSNLTPSTLYNVTMIVKSGAGTLLNEYNFRFVTSDNISDAVQSVQDAGGTSAPRKVIRDGQVYIEHNGKTYSVMGTEVSNH